MHFSDSYGKSFATLPAYAALISRHHQSDINQFFEWNALVRSKLIIYYLPVNTIHTKLYSGYALVQLNVKDICRKHSPEKHVDETHV